MQAHTVDVSEAQKKLRELVAMVQDGTEVVLTEGDTPLARLVPLRAAGAKRVPGLHAGAMWASDDFDAPLPEEFWSPPA